MVLALVRLIALLLYRCRCPDGMGMNGLRDATEEMIQAACDAANCAEFIAEFPNGLATLVGEKGIKLSYVLCFQHLPTCASSHTSNTDLAPHH